MRLNVILDTTKVTGFREKGEVTVIYSKDLMFNWPPGILRIGVVPIQVKLPGYPSFRPKARQVVEVLRSLLPAMLPLRADEIEVVEEPLLVYDRSDAGWFDRHTVYSLYHTLAAYLESYLRERNYTAGVGTAVQAVGRCLAAGGSWRGGGRQRVPFPIRGAGGRKLADVGDP